MAFKTSILFHIASPKDVSQEQNPTPIPEKKTRDLVLRFSNTSFAYFHHQTQIFPLESVHRIASTERNSTCSGCPLVQNVDCPLGYSSLRTKLVCFPATWGSAYGFDTCVWRLYPWHGAHFTQPSSRSLAAVKAAVQPWHIPRTAIPWNCPPSTCASTKTQLHGDQTKIILAKSSISILFPAQTCF